MRLYLAGQVERTARAVANVTAICDELLGRGNYALKVVDIVENPAVVEMEEILAVPMLVRLKPRPVRKVVGDLSQRATVLNALNLTKRSGIDPEHAHDRAESR